MAEEALESDTLSNPLRSAEAIARSKKTLRALNAHVMEHLVHGARGLRATGFPDHLGRNTRNCHIVRHRFDDNRARRHAGAVADLDIAENFGAGPDHDAVAYLGVTVALLAARA